MATAELTYRYLAPSTVRETDGRTEVSLATSGGREDNPYFFTGFLGAPRQTAQALLVVAEVARTRYYEPQTMVAARIAAADPVVASNLDRLRFESFSACAGVYARSTSSRDHRRSAPRVGDDQRRLQPSDASRPQRASTTRSDVDARRPRRGARGDARRLCGRKEVPLPERWLKGSPRCRSRVRAWSGTSCRRSRRGASSRACRAAKSRSVAWATPAGERAAPLLASRRRGCLPCRAGRLRLLEKLLPFTRVLRVYGPAPMRDRAAEPGAWGWARRRASSSVSRRALSRLLWRGRRTRRSRGRRRDGRRGGRGQLHEPAIDVDEVSRLAGIERSGVQTALGALGAAGRVGYDLGQSAYFHRELPYDRGALEKMHPACSVRESCSSRVRYGWTTT